ncbi:MAG: DUF3800 domain-containing protein [Oscillospiraceae bacterium]|jgi:hypothetical protein|nr:DUF3800 domain-containing protein [Oscillospiraceae bacterium]
MLVFVDESGHPRPTDNNTLSCLAAVCIDETDIRLMMQELFTLKQTLFGSQDEKKASKLINKNTVIHNRTNYVDYVNSVVRMFETYSCKTYAVVVEKPDEAVSFPDGLLPKHYLPILKIVELHCERENKSKSLFVYDSQDTGADSKIAAAFTNFLYKSSLGRGFNKILEIPLFASSIVTPCLQLVDIAASVIRHYHTMGLKTRKPCSDFEKWVDAMYSRIRVTTEDIFEPSTGFTHYGIYHMTRQIFQSKSSDVSG